MCNALTTFDTYHFKIHSYERFILASNYLTFNFILYTLFLTKDLNQFMFIHQAIKSEIWSR